MNTTKSLRRPTHYQFAQDGITITKPIRLRGQWVSYQYRNGQPYGELRATKRRTLGNYYRNWYRTLLADTLDA